MSTKFAGVTFDWYDDEGAMLKEMFPTVEELPEVIKEAGVKPKEKLANEDFALIAVDEGMVFRKYACHDPGTTAMSVIYFMEHGDKLPEAAQKLAAHNLVSACVEHGMMPPAVLTKTARLSPELLRRMISGGAVGALGGAVGGGLMSEKGETLKGALGGALTGGLAGGGLGALSLLRRAGQKALPAAVGAEVRSPIVTPAREPAGLLMPKAAGVIDITGQRPAPKVKEARPQDDADYALVLEDGTRRYPIDTWDRVKQAEQYWFDHSIRMHPSHRRQYAVKLSAKAEKMGYDLDGQIKEAGATTYGAQVEACVEMRKVAFDPAGEERAFLDDLMSKKASLDPNTFAEVLHRFDVEQGMDSGWDHVVPDPWSSTFGLTKIAEVVWEQGADRVTDDELVNLSRNRRGHIDGTFGEYFALEFQKDPIDVFKSLPDPQKKIIARMASDLSSDGGPEVTTTVPQEEPGLDRAGKPFKTTFGS